MKEASGSKLSLDTQMQDNVSGQQVSALSNLLSRLRTYQGGKHSILADKILPLHAPGYHVAAGFSPDEPASHSTLCLWPGKAADDSTKFWDPAPMWETQKRLWAPGFRSVQLRHLQSLGD